MNKIFFSSEKLSNSWGELFPLFADHWKEISHYNDIPLEPNLELYNKMEELGLVRLFTARDNSALVGYGVYVMTPDLHAKSSVQASQDVLYIDPKKRGFGLSFIKWCDEQMREMGAKIILRGVSVKCDYSRILSRIGYEQVGSTYSRRFA
jgi:hypothetical protein